MTAGQLRVSSALIVAVLPTWAAGPVPRLRQMLTALAAGRVMAEHKSPGDASLLCLQGRAVVHAGDADVELGPGDLVAVPPQRHDVEAICSQLSRWLPTTTTSCFSDETIVSVSEGGHAP